MENIGFSNCIVSQDQNKNILFGRLFASDKKKLREFRDGLIRFGFVSDCFDGATIDGSFVECSDFDEKLGVLYSKKMVGNEDGIVNYKEKFIYHLFPVTISILSSFLGDLNPNDFDNLTKKFIKNGVFKCEPIYDAWNNGLDRIFDKGFALSEGSFDYLALRFVIMNGLIQYDVFDQLSINEANRCRFLSGKPYRELEKILENSEMLLGNGRAERISDVKLFFDEDLDVKIFTKKNS